MVYANLQPPEKQPTCRHAAGGLLHRLLTLTDHLPHLPLDEEGAVCGSFLLSLPAVANSFPLGSGVSYAARTFLSSIAQPATDRDTAYILTPLRPESLMTHAPADARLHPELRDSYLIADLDRCYTAVIHHHVALHLVAEMSATDTLERLTRQDAHYSV